MSLNKIVYLQVNDFLDTATSIIAVIIRAMKRAITTDVSVDARTILNEALIPVIMIGVLYLFIMSIVCDTSFKISITAV